VAAFLGREGIAVRLNANCLSLSQRGDEIVMALDCDEGPREVVGSHLLVATGRRPNTDDLGLERAGIKLDARGYIEVDDELRTNVPGVWALGDCNGRGAFTHTAYNDFEIVAANVLDGGRRKVSDRIVAYALYTDPPLGRAGMTEAEVRRSGRRALVARIDMTDVARAAEKGETEGFMKVLIDADSKQILARRSSARAATRRSTASSTSCTRRRLTPFCSVPSTFTRRLPSSFRRCSRISRHCREAEQAQAWSFPTSGSDEAPVD